MDSDNSVVFGDEGNPNDVVLTWKRSNTSYYDTLVDDGGVPYVSPGKEETGRSPCGSKQFGFQEDIPVLA